MEPVRLGIIGCGVIGRRHLQAAQAAPFIKIVAVADNNRQKARDAGREFAVETVYFEAGELFNDPRIEGVILAIPTAGRSHLAIQALAKGKHVLVEKPVAMNVDEVQRMISARGKLIAGCCSSRFRFLEAADVITDFITSGSLGRLRLIRCRIIKAAGKSPQNLPPAWRLSKHLNGGGILVNWGCYDVDYLFGITGWTLRPQWVSAQTWGVPPLLMNQVAAGSDAEAHYVALIGCGNGITISLERGEYVAARPEEVWQVIGENGSLKLNMMDEQEKTIVYDFVTPEEGLVSKVIWKGTETASLIDAGPIRDFAGAIRENRQPKTSLEQALLIQKITDACYCSVDQGRAIEISW